MPAEWFARLGVQKICEDVIMQEYVKGLVSVVIPTYRRSDMLDRAIRSVLSQSYDNIELLLVNDNIPGDEYSQSLLQRVREYESDSRFRLILQEKHINGAVARNEGIKQARGEYIAFLDDDDWWEPEKIQKQVAVLSELPEEWGGASCKYSFVDRSGKIIGKSSEYKDGNIYVDILNLITDVTTCSLLLRHTALDEAGYFDENLLRHQDFQLLINFTYRYKLKLVSEYLLNIDVSDVQNRPDGEKLLEHKKRFFNSVSPVINQLSKREQRCIKCMHNFEVGYVFLKSRKILKGIRYLLSVFTSAKAFGLACKKSLKKIREMSRKQ